MQELQDIRNTVNISFWFSSCCGGWPLFFTVGPQWLLAALFATMPHKKRWTYTQPSKSLKRFSFSLPPLFTARRKAIEGKRKVKTEEEELAGNEFFFIFLIERRLTAFFFLWPSYPYNVAILFRTHFYLWPFRCQERMGSQHSPSQDRDSQDVQDAVVVLDRHPHGLPQHVHGGRGTL